MTEFQYISCSFPVELAMERTFYFHLSSQVLSTDESKSSCNLNNRLPKEVYQSCQKLLQVYPYPTLSPSPFKSHFLKVWNCIRDETYQ